MYPLEEASSARLIAQANYQTAIEKWNSAMSNRQSAASDWQAAISTRKSLEGSTTPLGASPSPPRGDAAHDDPLAGLLASGPDCDLFPPGAAASATSGSSAAVVGRRWRPPPVVVRPAYVPSLAGLLPEPGSNLTVKADAKAEAAAAVPDWAKQLINSFETRLSRKSPKKPKKSPKPKLKPTPAVTAQSAAGATRSLYSLPGDTIASAAAPLVCAAPIGPPPRQSPPPLPTCTA